MAADARHLFWIERILTAVGAALALWCAFAVGQAVYFDNLPIPAPVRASVLPGETVAPSTALAAPGSWFARLEAPSVGLAATVLEGSNDQTLAKAAGRIEYTALPGAGNTGIAGHRDTVFRPLRGLKVGDNLRLTTADKVFEYRVSKLSIVEPDAVHVLDPGDRPMLTLVTCYPFNYIGAAPRRYIVAATLESERPRTE
jgi:sortase A